MKTQEVPANIRFAARLVAGAIRRIRNRQANAIRKTASNKPNG